MVIKKEIISAIFISIAVLMLIASSSTLFGWAKFDRTREIGPVEYTLKADADPIGFSYEMSTKPAAGGGIIGGGGLGANITVDRVRKTYPEARGEFLDNLGIIYDSYRSRSYEYELIMRNPLEGSVNWTGTSSPSAYLEVELSADIIPFWRTSGKTGMALDVTFTGHDLVGTLDTVDDPDFKIRIDSVEVVGRKEIDPETGSYTGDEMVLYGSDEGWTLKEINDTVHLDFDVGYPEGAKVMGIFVRIDAHLTDFWGRPERQTLSGNSNPINVYPMDNGTLLRGAGIPLSIILIVLAVVSSLLSLLLILRNSPSYRTMTLISAGLSLGGVIWFYSGMLAAVDLLGRRLTGAEDGLSFGPGLYIALAGALVLLIVGIVAFLLPKVSRLRSKGKGTFTVVK